MLNTQLELIHMTGYKHHRCHSKREKELVLAYTSDVLQIAIGQGSACTPNCGAVMEGFTFSCSEFSASAFARHSLDPHFGRRKDVGGCHSYEVGRMNAGKSWHFELCINDNTEPPQA